MREHSLELTASVDFTAAIEEGIRKAAEAAEEVGEDLLAISLPKLRPEALHGVLGYIAEVGSANSEAVPAALAMNCMARFCALLGREPFIEIGDEVRSLRPFVLIIGPTAYGRKGTSTALPDKIFNEVGMLTNQRVDKITSMSSGEGVINMVKDDEDEMVVDQRVYFEISEFAGVLTQIKRESNILASTLRDAWDGRVLHVANKNSPIRSSHNHIVITTHITKEELLKDLSKTHLVNGFLNRFYLMYSIREKVVDRPQPVNHSVVNSIAVYIAKALEIAGARCKQPIMLNEEAMARWIEIRHELEGRFRGQHVAPLMVRASAYLWMFAGAIALINHKEVVEAVHLDAALAWVDYWEETANFCFMTVETQSTFYAGLEMSSKIVSVVRQHGGKEVPQSVIMKALTNNKPGLHLGPLIKNALAILQDESPPRLVVGTIKNGKRGRPANVFTLMPWAK
jgi:hypothetical protein